MNEPWRIALGVLFLAALVSALVWVLRSEPSTTNPIAVGPTTRVLETATTQARAVPPSPPTTAQLPATTVAPPVPPITMPTESTIPPPEQIDIRDVVPAAQAALIAWGEFAVSGDLGVLADTFDPDGPQYSLLVDEAPLLAADPLGPPPYVFTMGEPELERPRPQRVILIGPVVLTRPGEPDQSFTWRLHLRWSGSKWRLWTVEDA